MSQIVEKCHISQCWQLLQKIPANVTHVTQIQNSGESCYTQGRIKGGAKGAAAPGPAVLGGLQFVESGKCAVRNNNL